MKLLLVILHAVSSRGGAESYCVHLYHSLKHRNIQCRIAAASFEPGIDPVDQVKLSFDGLTRSGRYLCFLDSLDQHLKVNPYDLVHAMLPVRRCDIYHPQAGVESITFPRSHPLQRLTNRRRAWFARVERDLLEGKRPPVVLCMSERSRLETQSTFLIDTSRLITLYNGVDSDRFTPDNTPSEVPPRLVLIGQDFERKGVDIAIRAIARVPDVHLQIVGKDDPTTYKELADQLRVGERVEFCGPRSDVQNVLRGATALIHPARFEPFGMVVPEAILMGVPPIVSRISGASEIVRDGIDGRIVDQESDYSLAIRDVLQNHPTMRESCLKRRNELSYRTHLDKLLKIYDRILSAKR